jgi:hypothetical protein
MGLVDEDMVQLGAPQWRRDSTGRTSSGHCRLSCPPGECGLDPSALRRPRAAGFEFIIVDADDSVSDSSSQQTRSPGWHRRKAIEPPTLRYGRSLPQTAAVSQIVARSEAAM